MVQQLCNCVKTKWESQAMPRSSKAKSSTNKTGTKGTNAQQYIPQIK